MVTDYTSTLAQGAALPSTKKAGPISVPRVASMLLPDSVGLLEISAPINLNGVNTGQIVGLISFDFLYSQIFNDRSSTLPAPGKMDFIAISGSGQHYIPQFVNISEAEVSFLTKSLDNLTGKQSQTFRCNIGDVKEVFVISAPLEDIPLGLIWVFDSHGVINSTNPLIFLATFGVASLAVILSSLLAGRQFANSQVLASRLESSSSIRLEMEQKNEELIGEIEQRKKIEELLMREQALLRSLLDSIPDLIFYKSVDLRFIGCNKAFSQFVGLSQKNLVGQRAEDIASLASAHFLWEHDQEIVNQGLVVRKEESVHCPDGGKLLFDTVKTPYYSPNGETIGLISISRDIHERKQLEDDLVEQQDRLDLVLMAADIGLWDWYIESGETYFNERWANIIGYSLSELQPINIDTWLANVHPDDLLKSNRYIEDYFNGITDFYDCECRMRHKDGRWIWVLDRGRVIERFDDGRPLRMSGTHIDITRRMEAEINLKALNDSLEQVVICRTAELNIAHSKLIIQEKMASIGQLAAGVAHELNNPVNFIQTNFATLQEYFSDLITLFRLYKEALVTTTNQEQAYIIAHLLKIEKEMKFGNVLNDIPVLFDESEKGFERVGHIIRTMRDFSRQNEEEQFGEVDVNQSIENTLIISRNEYKYDTVIEKNFSPIPLIEGINELLSQVFLNLIVNGVYANSKAHRDGKSIISIRTWNDKNFVYCSFQDTGTGILPEHLNRIFEPFFTTKPPGQGTGLGLSISYDIVVHKHQGFLAAENQASGGAIFVVKLPIKQERGSAVAEVS